MADLVSRGPEGRENKLEVDAGRKRREQALHARGETGSFIRGRTMKRRANQPLIVYDSETTEHS